MMGIIFNWKPLKSKVVVGQKPCSTCKGHGYMIYSKASNTTAAPDVQWHVPCPSCGGLGYIYDLSITAGHKE